MKLEEKAVLVTLSVGTWEARKLDKQVTKETQRQRGATEDSCSVWKNLVAKEAIDKVNQTVTRIRKFNYSVTVVWDDRGTRMFNCDGGPDAMSYFDYMAKMADYQREYWDAVEEFLREYPALRRDAEDRRLKGGLFNPKDYPPIDKLRERFKFTLDIDPMPSSDFRVNLTGDEVNRLEADLEARFSQRMEKSMREVWERLYKPIENMVERLGNPDTKKFFDTLVTNVREIVDLEPTLNITGDARLTAMAQDIKDRLCKYDVEVLKEDPDLRKSTAKQAQEILDAMATYMGAA